MESEPLGTLRALSRPVQELVNLYVIYFNPYN
jgi:hypothetical protein